MWVINGFFVWLPLENPAGAFPGESKLGGGVTALIGATIFEVGAVMQVLEAVNENHADCFGWALEEAVESGELLLRQPTKPCQHPHNRRRACPRGQGNKVLEAEDASGKNRAGRPARSFSWWPSWRELRTHYLTEIAFWACLIQLFGATVFWISGFTGLPSILGALSIPASNGIYWLPQVSFLVATDLLVATCIPWREVEKKRRDTADGSRSSAVRDSSFLALCLPSRASLSGTCPPLAPWVGISDCGISSAASDSPCAALLALPSTPTGLNMHLPFRLSSEAGHSW